MPSLQSIFVVIFFQTSAVKDTLSLFTCVKVGDSWLLYDDASIDCRSSSHLVWQLAAAASLITNIVLLPGITFNLMYQKRHAIMDLDDPDHTEAQRTFGFLINSLEVTNGWYYWERA